MKKLVKAFLYTCPILGTFLKLRHCRFVGLSFWRFIFLTLFAKDKSLYWPKYKSCSVSSPENIIVGKNSSIGNKGCYIQGVGKLIIGDYVRLATNVGIISGNHNLYNHFEYDRKETIIGDYTYIGMNAVILPGVILGTRTVVGAGSVVTKSFPEGYCVIGGNPAVLLRNIEKEKFIPFKAEYEFYGYIPGEKFESFKKKHLRRSFG